MLLLGALFALFVVGFWLYCLIDVVLTPSDECPRLPKAAWVAVVAGTFVIGAVTWLAVRRPAQPTVASLAPSAGPAASEPPSDGPEEHADPPQASSASGRSGRQLRPA